MNLTEFMTEWNNLSPYITVHTSGSTGRPKPIKVEKKRMEASARLTCNYLGLGSEDTALLCMPLDYIAGKMVVVRSLVSGMRLINVKPSSHPMADVAEIPTFAAMTPMQVYGSMHIPSELNLLKRIRCLIIGGGAIDDAMERELHNFPNAVWSTYGMTETLSHIALRRLSGDSADGWYTPFDNVDVSLGQDGCLIINAPDVCPETLYTNDIARLHPDGRRFMIVGRKDNVIDSGGIKIHMEEIEKALQPHLTVPYIATKCKDARLGEAVVLLVATGDISAVKAVCDEILPRYWRPKVYLSVSDVPFTETGKPARKKALEMAEKLISEKRTGRYE